MSKTLTHGKADGQITGDHTRRIAAIERNLSLEQARYGIPALRDRLFLAAGVSRGEACRNFEPGFSNTSGSIGSGASRYCAVYWPGGTCTGMTFIMPTVGSYSDTTPVSGGALYSYDGTTLTRIAAQPQKWATASYPTSGFNRLQWALPVYMVEGVYYVAFRYFAIGTPSITPTFATAQAADATVWGGDVNQDATPTNWPLMFTDSGASTQLPSSITASGLTVGVTVPIFYAGLY